MVPSITHSNASTPSSQDHLYFQHQQQHYQQQQQRQIHQQQQQQQHQHHQSLASNFHLLHMVENLAEVIENGTWDQHSDALVWIFCSHNFVNTKSSFCFWDFLEQTQLFSYDLLVDFC